jgi:uncharacterized protein (TIGR03437 family)
MSHRSFFLARVHEMAVVLSAVALICSAGFAGVFPWGAVSSPASSSAGTLASRSSAKLVADYGQLPLRFEANYGQSDRSVRFLVRGSGYTLFLRPNDAVLSAIVPESAPQKSGTPPEKGYHNAFFRVRLRGADRHARAEALEPLPGTINYFVGSDASRWLTTLPCYRKVAFRGVYPGIDLIYYGDGQQLEFDFSVAPGADPRRIRMAFEGSGQPHIGRDGALQMEIGGQQLRFHAPRMYQEAAGERRRIAGGYVLRGLSEVGFQVGAYDARQRLVIDPVLSYAALVAPLQGRAIAVDSAGDAYITGFTSSAAFPVTSGAPQGTIRAGGCVWGTCSEAFVSKINPLGSALIYSTFLGGIYDEYGQGIAVDAAGNAYVAGITQSPDFPTTAGALQRTWGGGTGCADDHCADAFVAKLNPTGTALLYSTYLGGAGDDDAMAIAIDSAGNAYVAGAGYAIPTTAGAFQTKYGGPFPSTMAGDAFVAKLNPTGSALVYATYLGGSGYDRAFGIAVDAAGNAYVVGDTLSTDFPTKNPIQAALARPSGAGQIQLSDIFVAKIDPTGSALVLSTYLGGSGGDTAYAVALDNSGNVYITGQTASPNFPTLNAFQPKLSSGADDLDAFVAKINAAGSALVYSTYLGGGQTADHWGTNKGNGIAVDAAGNAHVTGYTYSAAFPLANAIQSTKEAGQSMDTFITKLNPSGSGLIYSTLLGGGMGNAITVDASGNAYVTGFGGTTFHTTAGALTASGGDIFVAKISDPSSSGPAPAINAGGVVNSATFSHLPPAAGGIGSLFGTNLASGVVVADKVPLPTTLGGVSVQLNGVAAPLFFVSAAQINFQIPWEVLGQTQASITVTVNGVTSPAQTLSLAPYAPGIFTTNQAGTGQGVIAIATSGELAAPAGSIPGRTSRPAKRGEFISIYCSGLGPVSNPPASGAPATGSPLSLTTKNPTVTIGGVSAPINFSGLTPGFVALYQVNAQVPDNAPVGDAVNLVLTIEGVASNTVTIAVQ